ncbi:PIN domain-containing protein [Thioalkalivibrio sulfidiphilus]|uniref:PIN domain-containing protein n=1 Tax=Thioalkalivibrio sulfidiphilus TaxID=1033854 RepID=UPI003B2F72CB
MPYLLDTNILIAAMKGHPQVREHLEVTPLQEIVLSPVVLGELELGVAKSRYRDKNAARLAELVRGIALQPIDAEVARHYARIRAALEQAGTPIGANDYWIAAQALAQELILVSDNVREFSRVDGLKLQNWMAAS